MNQAELEKVLGQIERDRAETKKLVNEAGKIKMETWFYPLIVGAGIATAVAAVLKVVG